MIKYCSELDGPFDGMLVVEARNSFMVFSCASDEFFFRVGLCVVLMNAAFPFIVVDFNPLKLRGT